MAKINPVPAESLKVTMAQSKAWIERTARQAVYGYGGDDTPPDYATDAELRELLVAITGQADAQTADGYATDAEVSAMLLNVLGAYADPGRLTATDAEVSAMIDKILT